MSNIPQTLKTGLGSPGYIDIGSTDETAKRLISLVVVMSKEAADLAYTLAVHDRRNKAGVEDVNNALKYQARNFLHRLDDPDVVAEVMSTESDLFGDDRSDSDNTETIDVTDVLEQEERIRSQAVFNGNTCVCSTCVDVRQSLETWDAWDPDDQAEAFLRQSVEHAIQKYEEHKEAYDL